MRTAVISCIASGLLVLLVGILTLMPITVPAKVMGYDKLHHLLGFAAIIFPVAFLHPRALWYAAPLVMIYGAVIELIQPYVGRSRELVDFYADCLGVVVGVALGLVLRALALRLREALRRPV